jgi:uncharacterized protein YndB with AHSA1/START domain
LTVWQLFAATMAALLLIGWIAMVGRFRRVSAAFVVSLLLGVPAVAFGVYALWPGPPPQENAVVALGVVLYAAIFVALPFAIIARRKPRTTVYLLASDSRRYRRALILRMLVVSWLSAMVYLFEPGFALAYVAINVVWIAVWIPPQSRVARYENGTEIAAPPERVFAFLTDPRNWPGYRDMELVSQHPEGPLELGTEYTARVAIPQGQHAERYRQVESRYRVIAMVRGRSYTTTLVDQPGNDTTTSLEPTAAGTRLTVTSDIRVPLPQAASGGMLDIPLATRGRRAVDATRFAKLKQALEQPAAQV